MITKFNIFLNESLKDKMSPKSPNDIVDVILEIDDIDHVMSLLKKIPIADRTPYINALVDIEIRKDVLNELILMMSVYDEPKLIQKIVDRGADLECEDSSGNTPLMLSVKYNNLDNVKVLLDSGADIKTKAIGADVFTTARERGYAAMELLLKSYK